MTTPDTYRLITRSDMDGLVCAVLLSEMGILGEIEFHHPKDVQDGLVQVSDRDILTNLPYVEGCAMCFDHHASQARRLEGRATPGYVLDPDAKSAARVVYDHFGGRERFPNVSVEMMAAVDKADCRRLHHGRRAGAVRLGAALVPDGCTHGPRTVPRLPRLRTTNRRRP